MGKKINVVADELGHKGNGIYCVYPFTNLDKDGKGCYKIGMTTESYKKRIDSYHTYFPQGVYLVAFLEKPPINTRLLRGTEKEETIKKLYLKIEKFIIQYILDAGGRRIYSTARVQKVNEKKRRYN